MPYKSGHLSEIVTAAINGFKVLKDIVQSYLVAENATKLNPEIKTTVDLETSIFDVKELNHFLSGLNRDDLNQLKRGFNGGYKRYLSPLPTRPHATELIHAYSQYLLTLKKYTELTGHELINTGEELFTQTLAEALYTHRGLNLQNLSAEKVDDLFEELEASFRMRLIAHIKGPFPLPKLDTSFKTISALDGAEKPTPTHSPYNLPENSTAPTPILHPQDSPVKKETVYDSDLEEEVEETIIGLRKMGIFSTNHSETPTTPTNNHPSLADSEKNSSVNHLSEKIRGPNKNQK